MSDIIITPASGKIDFYQDLGGSSLAKIELTNANDLALSTTSGNLIIGDASRDVYIGDGVNNVDIVFEQNGEIRPLSAKTLVIGASGAYTEILATKIGINKNSLGSIPLDVYSSVSGSTLFNIAGTNGNLFSVTDSLSGSLMSVNNSAGLPVFEVFSDDRVVAGRFGQNDFIMTSGGNVGIGTGVPSSKFHVVGISTFGGDVSSTGSFIAGLGSASNPSFEFNGDTDTGMFAPSGDILAFATSGVERVRINNIGNIGIGTTTPSGQLHVIGTGLFSNRLGVGISGFPNWTSQAATPHTFVHISGASGLFPDVNERAFGSLLRLNSGASTNNPRIDFRIGGPGNYDDNFFIARNGSDVIGIDTSNRMFLPNGFTILNPTNNGEGTNASIRSFNDASSFITLDNNTRSMIIGYRGKGAGDQYINVSSSGRLKIYNYYAEVATFDNRGRFGIGTSTPSGQLHAIGTGIISSRLDVSNLRLDSNTISATNSSFGGPIDLSAGSDGVSINGKLNVSLDYTTPETRATKVARLYGKYYQYGVSYIDNYLDADSDIQENMTIGFICDPIFADVNIYTLPFPSVYENLGEIKVLHNLDASYSIYLIHTNAYNGSIVTPDGQNFVLGPGKSCTIQCIQDYFSSYYTWRIIGCCGGSSLGS